MIIKIDDKEYNTEISNVPFMVVFRQDELWNMLMYMIQNPNLSRFAVMPTTWPKEQKEEYLNSVPTPKTPEVIQKAVAVLKQEFLSRFESSVRKGEKLPLGNVKEVEE